MLEYIYFKESLHMNQNGLHFKIWKSQLQRGEMILEEA